VNGRGARALFRIAELSERSWIAAAFKTGEEILAKVNRRTFFKGMISATLLTRHFGWAVNSRRINQIGLSLFTVRKEMERDLEGTLAKVAAIGYREVEFAGYFNRSPQEVRSALDRCGLVALSTHVDYESLAVENWARVLEASKIVGTTYIVNPWIDDDIRKQPDGWHRAAETFNRAGEASRKAHIQFAYHNHFFEFQPVNGKLPYDILLQECDPDLVKMEMDLCWIIVGGGDPLTYFNRYPGRFPMVHVKDMKKIPSDKTNLTFDTLTPDMTEVGSGIIDWKRIFAHSEKAGIKHYIVEDDEPKSAFENIKTSYEYLNSLRF
jgi:sugar phosphate isomerase/epimerase